MCHRERGGPKEKREEGMEGRENLWQGGFVPCSIERGRDRDLELREESGGRRWGWVGGL